MTDFISIGILIVYFIVQIFWTQKIYSKKLFLHFLGLVLLTFILIYFLTDKDKKYDLLIFNTIFLWYLLTLLLIKLTYKTCNKFLINKKLINTKFNDKDFTYTHYSDIVGIDNYWDEKLATKPSLFDNSLTFLVFTIPFLFVALLS
jgi:hypothetical protein